MRFVYSLKISMEYVMFNLFLRVLGFEMMWLSYIYSKLHPSSYFPSETIWPA